VKIGVLTGGGDCPGLNPAIRAIVARALDYGYELLGLRRGWAGLVEGETMPLNFETVEPIIDQGGTILESSRTNPLKDERLLDRCLDNFRKLGLHALITLGGEDTLGVAHRLAKLSINCVGVPKTMDNDLNATDYTFGFDSAVSVAVDAADRLKDTARSHRRVMVLEVMGRHAGWVALHTGICAGADWVLIPEVATALNEVADHIRALKERGKHWGLIVVSEGVEVTDTDTESLEKDEFGHVILRQMAVGDFVASEIKQRAEIDTRAVILGHVVRGGAPTPFDRWLATRVGIKAVELVHEGKFDHMAALQGGKIVGVPLEAAVEELKTVPVELYNEVKTLFSR
jgi:phosphofructokinase-like protein